MAPEPSDLQQWRVDELCETGPVRHRGGERQLATIGVMDAGMTPLLALSGQEKAQLSALVQAALEPNPFYEPGCLLPAAAHLPGGTEVSLAFVRDGDQMLAAVPTRRLLKLAGTAVITSRPFQVINLGTPLLAAGAPERTMDSLLSVLARESGAGVLALEWLGDNGPVGHAVRCAAKRLRMPCRTYRQWERPVLNREGSALCTKSRCTLCQKCALLSPKRAKALSRWQRGIARELGSPPEATDRSGQPEWVERYLSLESAGWKGGLGPGTGDLAHRPGHAEWFRESVRDLSMAGRARLFSLTAGPHLLAMFYMVRTPGRGAFAWAMSYDETFRPYAPGVQLLLETVRAFFQEGEDVFYDSCTIPSTSHFSEFFPGSRTISNVAIGIGNAAAKAAVVAAPTCALALRGARRRVRRLTSSWTVS